MTEIKISKKAIEIFEKSVNDYHVYDDITRNPNNPFDNKIVVQGYDCSKISKSYLPKKKKAKTKF